jgi:hypothetical protein
MQRRTFLLGLLGSLAAAGMVPKTVTSANAISLTPSEGAEAADISLDDLEAVKTEVAQYYRRRARRVYRRYYRRPYRRYRRRVRRYYRRGRWYYY